MIAALGLRFHDRSPGQFLSEHPSMHRETRALVRDRRRRAAASSCAKPAAARRRWCSSACRAVIESTKAYPVALNKTERDHYLDDQVTPGR